VSFTVAPNTSSVGRGGSIRVGGMTVFITQTGGGAGTLTAPKGLRIIP
jgi:hypothetical protein